MNSAGKCAVGANAADLSGGDKDRVGFACAMKRSTCSDCRRSSSRRGRKMMSQPSRSSRRTMADPDHAGMTGDEDALAA